MAESDSSDDGDSFSTDLMGFMFGNIDKHGNLENDILDHKAKSQLDQLSSFADLDNFGNFVNTLKREEKKNEDKTSKSPVGQDGETVVPNQDAVDYSNINELADENEHHETSSQHEQDLSTLDEVSTSPRKSSSQKDSIGDDDIGIILPSIVTNTPSDSATTKDRKSRKDGKKSGLNKHEKKKRRKERLLQQQMQVTKEEKMLQDKMNVLEEKISKQDITQLFPQFRHSQVLRFLRLFAGKNPSSLPNVWKNCRKRKKKRNRTVQQETDVKVLEPSDKWKTQWKAEEAQLPAPEQCLEDQEITMMKPMASNKHKKKVSNQNGDSKHEDVAEWRYGPAALWYDMLGVPENGQDFDYGFKLKKPGSNAFNGTNTIVDKQDFPSPQHFYMVSQVKWEDDIIWDADDVKNKPGNKSIIPTLDADDKYKLRVDRAAQAGWVPTSTQRTALPSGSTTRPISIIEKPAAANKDDPASSIFPIDNYELIYGNWEKDIIWDDQNMDFIPKPTVFRFDPNDENIILSIPDEPKFNSGTTETTKEPGGNKKEIQKKTRNIIGKTGGNKEPDEPEEDSLVKKDKWNLSNDEFYDPKKSNPDSISLSLVGTILQHSTPAMELQPMFFPTCMTSTKLAHYHRPRLRHYNHGEMTKPGFRQVHCVQKYLRKKAKQREQERAASGGGDVFFMRRPEDLTALDGHLILAEYSEEYPVLLSQVGMALKVKNYYKRKPDKDMDIPKYRYGEPVFSHNSPFLGSLSPGQSLQTFECSMYRAPVYEHRSQHSDFLIIRTRYNYFIRHVPCIFTVGQLCPLLEVPGPNSKRATNHVRDFLQVFIYRLFSKSRDNPKKIRMEEIRRAFPNHSESSIRKRLKLCADFNRTGVDSNWWVLRSDFRLPTEEEMRAMVSPEATCAFYSMLAAEHRLKDAGYGEKSMLCPDMNDDNDEDHQNKVDEEVLNAPWNTTRAFISAIKKKCLLQVTGTADPTGCGEGFSYVKVPMKPQQAKVNQKQTAQKAKQAESASQPKKLVTGTDADLRRLSLTNAKQLLKKFGVADEEIKKLSRWEVIDVVRTMSTEQARSGEGGMSKFARGTRFSVAEHQERYKEECQRIFDLQNKVLSSHEQLSTDEDSSSADDSDFEEMGKNIENLLSNKKSSVQMSLEKEEKERKELLKMFGSDGKSSSSTDGKKSKKDHDHDTIATQLNGRCLKIRRKFRNDDGTEYIRVETVRKPEIIDAYVKIRSQKNAEFIRKYIMMDEKHREEMRREKRRIQEQLRRIKRNQEKEKAAHKRRKEMKEMKLDQSFKGGSQMRCGACGNYGHMRTNRDCPKYNSFIPDNKVALTEEEEEDMERNMFHESQSLVKVEGTKMTFSRDLLKSAEKVRRKSLVLKFQKSGDSISNIPSKIDEEPHSSSDNSSVTATPTKKKRKYGSSVVHCDYLTRIAQKKERRRTDPAVTLATHFETVLNGIRDIPDTTPFYVPVNPRLVKDYYKIIEKPMDLQTMRDNIRKHIYMSRADFLEHVDLIVNNSRIYNGNDSNLTKTAIKMIDYTKQQFALLEDKLMRLEKAINPLLDDDDQVAFSFILDQLLTQKMMAIEDSWPFHNPVNRKFVPDYYDVIERPMDLGTIRKNVQKHLYQNRGQFMEHVELIVSNSAQFNGADSSFTDTARRIVERCREALDEHDNELTQLENDIAAAKKAAEAEAADIDDPSNDINEDLEIDEDSNMSFMTSQDDKQQDPNTNMDQQLLMAFADAGGRDEGAHNQMDGDGEEKNRLLEDLLMSDGEMSNDEESEDEGDNPFAASDSDGSDDGGDTQGSNKSKSKPTTSSSVPTPQSSQQKHPTLSEDDDDEDMLSVQEDTDDENVM